MRFSTKGKILTASLIGIVLLLYIIFKDKVEVQPTDFVELQDSVEIVEIATKYGLPIDNYEVRYGVVERNQNLSSILTGQGLDNSIVHDLVQSTKDTFDVKKIRVGQAFAIFLAKDAKQTPEYFVYEIDELSYVKYNLKPGSYSAVHGLNPVEYKKRQVSGGVQTSLWNAMSSLGADPLLAVDLSSIFGWSIDFFGLQKQDSFDVIYSQSYVDNKPLSKFQIDAARFTSGGKTFYAFPFFQDSELMYFDENGNSLEGAFLKAPLDYFRITSRFTNSRYHPVLKRYRAHHGVDYAAPVGTPVYAIGKGVISAKGYQSGGGGNYLKIKHGGSYETSYMHLSKFAKGIAVGTHVEQKQVIGYVGSTGLSTGPHLDFRVYENGKPINPLTVRSQPKAPIKPENMPKFVAMRDSLMVKLNELSWKH